VPVVAIVAQVGYGKTTLLEQWQRRDDRPFAWVSVDERDDDPAVLLTYIAAALDRVAPIDPAIRKTLASPGASVWSRALPGLGAELLSLPSPVVIVLDDADFLRRRETVDTILALAQHLRDGSQLVLSCRSHGSLRLAGLRADGQLFELGARDLRMGSQEARVLLRSAGIRVNESDAAELVRRTEGWPAGLFLAARSLEASGEAAGPYTFGGRDRYVADYLRDAQVSALPRKTIEFLRRTSILDRLNASLCDAVLARDGSGRMLDSLERTNLFLVPLDQQRESYRYHRLFREMLQGELERHEPHLVAELNRRAADWCQANGEQETAVDYAIRAGDLDRVARLVAAHALPLHYAGRLGTVERWLGVFDDDRLIAGYPAVAMLGAWVHALRGRTALADRWGDLAGEGSSAETLPDGSRIEPWLAILRAARCRHGVGAMRADAELALETLAPASRWRPTAVLLVAMSHLLAGDDVTADAVLARAVEAAAGAAAPAPARLALAERALIALDQGRLHEAEHFLESAERLVDGNGLADYGSSTVVLAARARTALRRGDSATARDDLARAQRLRPQLGCAFPWLATQALLELARAALSLVDVSGARALLADADDVLRLGPDLGVLAGRARDLRAQLSSSDEPQARWAGTLTAAELRLLPLLTTHLSFREIAARLYVSRNTVKAQAISLYRKLHVTSRSEAIERATELGLVDSPVVRPTHDFTPAG
jgi:LuxR family maltose regulon positive regulatory protein